MCVFCSDTQTGCDQDRYRTYKNEAEEQRRQSAVHSCPSLWGLHDQMTPRSDKATHPNTPHHPYKTHRHSAAHRYTVNVNTQLRWNTFEGKSRKQTLWPMTAGGNACKHTVVLRESHMGIFALVIFLLVFFLSFRINIYSFAHPLAIFIGLLQQRKFKQTTKLKSQQDFFFK